MGASTLPVPCTAAARSRRRLAWNFPIIHDGVEVDAFKVAIELHPEEGAHRPLVFETGGRVPRSPDRHMNGDGSACIALPEDVLLLTHGEPMPLSAFMAGPCATIFSRKQATRRRAVGRSATAATEWSAYASSTLSCSAPLNPKPCGATSWCSHKQSCTGSGSARAAAVRRFVVATAPRSRLCASECRRPSRPGCAQAPVCS